MVGNANSCLPAATASVCVCLCLWTCMCVPVCVLCAISICSGPAAAAAIALTCNMQHSHRVANHFQTTHARTHEPVVKRHFDLFSVRQQTPCWQQHFHVCPQLPQPLPLPLPLAPLLSSPIPSFLFKSTFCVLSLIDLLPWPASSTVSNCPITISVRTVPQRNPNKN